MKTGIILTAIVVTLSLCGCSSTRPYTVKLDSEPEGAHVFMAAGSFKRAGAREFLGTTPCTATITGTKDGHFIAPRVEYASDYVSGIVVFTFEPPGSATNLFSHSQSYKTPTDYVAGDKIPQAIFFDMTKP